MIGTSLGHYKMIEPLGQGGMGEARRSATGISNYRQLGYDGEEGR